MEGFSRRLRLFAVAWLAALQTSTAATVVVNSTFTDSTFDGNYSNPGNWAPAEVPNNTANKFYNVTAQVTETLLRVDMDATVLNLTLNGDLETSNDFYGPTLVRVFTVTRATTLIPGSQIVLSSGEAPLTFSLGSLSTFADGVLTGTYALHSHGGNGGPEFPATLQFKGANVISLSRANLSLFGSTSHLVDENGADGLRNLARIEADSYLGLDHSFATVGDFTVNGTLSLSAISSAAPLFRIAGSLTNFDRISRTLLSGRYQINGSYGGAASALAALQFTGADIVNNGTAILLYRSAAIIDESGRDALSNLSRNLPAGQLTLINHNMKMRGDFLNDGLLDAKGSSIVIAGDVTNTGAVMLDRQFADDSALSVATGHTFRQSAGRTAIIGAKFSGAMEIQGGELSGASIPPPGSPPFLPGSTATITGKLTVGGGVLNPRGLSVNGDVQLSSGSTLHYFADTSNSGITVSGRLALGGNLEVEYPAPFPAASMTVFTLASAGTLTGEFSNVGNGGRITTSDGAGSFAFSVTSENRLLLTDYLRAVPAAQLLNISSRVQVLTGDNAAVAGFIIYGHDPKKVVIRALGPSLTGSGVNGALQDPTIELHDAKGSIIATNDNWQDTQKADINTTGVAPGDPREAAIVATLQPGAYTAVLRGKNDTTGVALVEVYDLAKDSRSKLANISTRGFVAPGDVLIGGLIAGGNGQGNAELVVRAIGSALQTSGVKNNLADPALEVRDGNGAVIAANDDFSVPRENSATVPSELDVSYYSDAATGVKIPAGTYTVVVRGKNGASGLALVEVYDLNL